MQALINALAGKKSYLISASGILASVVGLATGQVDLAGCVGGILASLGISTLRAGISKTKPEGGGDK